GRDTHTKSPPGRRKGGARPSITVACGKGEPCTSAVVSGAGVSWGAPAAAKSKRTAREIRRMKRLRSVIPKGTCDLSTVRLDQVVARLLEMLADERLRLLRVALVEGIEDAAVLPVILGDHLGRQNLLFHRVPLRVQAHVID